MLGWLKTQLSRSTARAWVIGAAILLSCSSLGVGLTADDYFHTIAMRDNPGVAGFSMRPFDLFSFARGDAARTHSLVEEGVFPWWTDPELRIAFARPLSSATHWLDYTLWPTSPAMMHAQNLCWFGLLLLSLAALYRALVPVKWIAMLALLIYGIDDARAPAVGWVANRNVFVALAPAFFALLCHHRARAEGQRLAAWLSPLALLVGLLGGEPAVGVLGYLFAYAVFLDRGTWHARALALLPHAVVVVSWRVAYKALGYGAQGSGLYLDPASSPLSFLKSVSVRMPALLLGQFGMPWSDFWELYPLFSAAIQPVLWVAALLLITALVAALWPLLRLDARVRFWGAGMLIAVLPGSAAIPNDRLLGSAAVGASALLAIFIGALYERTYPAMGPWVARFGKGMVGVHLVMAPLLLPARMLSINAFEALMWAAEDSIPSGEDITHKTVIALNPPADPLVLYFPIYREAFGIPRPRAMRWLATGVSDIRLSRTDAYTLLVEPKDGFLSYASNFMVRSLDQPFHVGDRVVLSDCSYEIRSLSSDGRPAKVSVRFNEPLESASFLFVEWKEHGYVPFHVPAVGAVVDLPRVDLTTALLLPPPKVEIPDFSVAIRAGERSNQRAREDYARSRTATHSRSAVWANMSNTVTPETR